MYKMVEWNETLEEIYKDPLLPRALLQAYIFHWQNLAVVTIMFEGLLHYNLSIHIPSAPLPLQSHRNYYPLLAHDHLNH